MSRHANVAIFVPHVGCPLRCSFCNQHVISGSQRAPTPEEVRETCRQALDHLGLAAAEGEIAFFGGSFTAIPRPMMLGLLEAAQPFLGRGKFGGIRLSTRPDAIDGEILSILKAYGVTTIELGAQSMHRTVLARAGRGHSPDDTRQAAELIRAEGFRLGLQMMPGLGGPDEDEARATARALAALKPEEVRIYPTLVIRGTRLEEEYLRGEYKPLELEQAVELCAGLLRFFAEENIRVIRLGLHASRELEEQLVAGPYHPAFRELCESRMMLETARDLLRFVPKGPVTLAVRPQDRSRMTGQKKANLLCLAREGWQVTLREEPGMEPMSIKKID